MNEEARKAAARYAREWRRKNPEKAREARERYWERKATQYSKSEEEKR